MTRIAIIIGLMLCLSGCANVRELFEGQAAAEPAQAVDSFCAAYQKVVVAKGDAADANKTAPTLRRRIARNEILYRCRCEGWQNSLCPRA